MSQLTKMFAPTLLKIGFFSEWARYVSTRSSPETLANVVLELMRDAEHDDRRAAASMFASFIKIRTWEDVLLELKDEIPATTFDAMGSSFAKGFYAEIRILILMQIEAYWREMKEANSQDFQKEVTETLSIAIVELIKQQVVIQMNALVPTIVAAMKKTMREESGDSWKDEEGN